MKKLKLKIQGMHCPSCEVLIERKFKKVNGVYSVNVSRANEDAEIECSDGVTLEQLQEAVKDDGYILSVKNEHCSIDAPSVKTSSVKTDYLPNKHIKFKEIGASLIIIFALYFLFKQLNIFPQNLGVVDNMSFGFVFLIGLAAAASTCLAVSGGLILAIATKFNEQYPAATKQQRFLPHVYFNVGRIVSYTLLGGLIGILGSTLALSSKVTGIITIITGILMIIIGVQLLGIIPWINKFQLKMPKFIYHRLYDSSNNDEKKINGLASFLFGAATFFLPCGFTMALQLYVLGKGDFITGALTMLAFSLGTLPSLISIGIFSSYSKGKLSRYFATFSAVLIIILGLFNLPAGVTLTGAAIGIPDLIDVNSPNSNSAASSSATLQEAPANKQIIDLEVNGLDYHPSQFNLVAGIPVEWRIDGTKARGCAQIISVPKLGITEYLKRDQLTIITFTPKETGAIRFSCGMGMAGPGTFNVMPNSQQSK